MITKMFTRVRGLKANPMTTSHRPNERLKSEMGAITQHPLGGMYGFLTEHSVHRGDQHHMKHMQRYIWSYMVAEPLF